MPKNSGFEKTDDKNIIDSLQALVLLIDPEEKLLEKHEINERDSLILNELIRILDYLQAHKAEKYKGLISKERIVLGDILNMLDESETNPEIKNAVNEIDSILLSISIKPRES